jgi:dihydroorotase
LQKKLEAVKNETVFEAKGAVLSPGFFDLNCMLGDPGLETKEDIKSGTAAAQAGGFTGVAVLPITKPVVQSKGEIAYILNKAKNNLVDVYPIGAISKDLEGKGFS